MLHRRLRATENRPPALGYPLIPQLGLVGRLRNNRYLHPPAPARSSKRTDLLMQNPSVMQNLVDSLCQCFGTAPQQNDLKSFHSHDQRTGESGKSTPATPDMKRRTRSLALQDKQWDALFSSECPAQNRNRASSMQPPRRGQSLELAQAVAKAKLAASQKASRKGSPACKRKRTSSRDDIFRSKREPPPNTTNAFSRFLTSNPVIMNSLCFATPVRGDSFYLDAASVVSDSNTLNTAEDTITSTLYYETTKLAGLKQKNPPMPLFNSYAVEAEDDIHKIVNSRSHNSFKMLDKYKQHPDENIELEEEVTPPTSPNRRTFAAADEEGAPPPVMKLSSESSSSSHR